MVKLAPPSGEPLIVVDATLPSTGATTPGRVLTNSIAFLLPPFKRRGNSLISSVTRVVPSVDAVVSTLGAVALTTTDSLELPNANVADNVKPTPATTRTPNCSNTLNPVARTVSVYWPI